jgi:hypothetical protein
MRGRAAHGLEELNGRLMDGLTFCKKAYRLFDTIRNGPEGVKRLRLRPGHDEAKKLIEEVLPIARYVQMKYSLKTRLKIRWIDGSQPYDAYLSVSVPKYVPEEVRKTYPRDQHLEVTTAAYRNDFLSRLQLHTVGGSFGPREIKRDLKTGKISSKPHVYDRQKMPSDFSALVKGRIKSKAKKNYPENTSLVIRCELDTIFLDNEWDCMIEEVRKAEIKHRFREIFLFDSLMHFATL